MGLLDMFGTSMDDPRTAATLQLAQGLLSSPRVMQGLAGGLSGYQQAMAQAKQAKMMEEMRSMQMAQQRMQLEAAQRQQAKEQGIEEDYRNAYRTPEQMAIGKFGPTAEAAAAIPQMEGGFDQKALRDSLAKRDPLTAYKLFGPKAPENMVVGGSLVQVGPSGVKELYRPQEKSTPTDIGKLFAEMGALPEGDPRRAIYQDAIRKATTHAPATSVSYGAPVAGVDARGNPVFFQPDKAGGAPAIIPGVAPPKQKLGEKQTNQNAGIDALSSAVDDYVAQLGTWQKRDILSPDKRADMGTYYKNLMLQAKEAYNLGVLNGPDLAILQDVVQDPVSIMGTVTSNDALARQATSLRRIMNKVKAANLGQTPSAPSGKPSTAVPDISLDAIEAEMQRRRAARGG